MRLLLLPYLLILAGCPLIPTDGLVVTQPKIDQAIDKYSEACEPFPAEGPAADACRAIYEAIKVAHETYTNLNKAAKQ